jgi:hypothetical protein
LLEQRLSEISLPKTNTCGKGKVLFNKANSADAKSLAADITVMRIEDLRKA